MTTGDGADGAVTRITNSLLSVSLNGLDLRVRARKKGFAGTFTLFGLGDGEMVHAAVRAGGTAGRVTRGRTRRRGLDLATTPGRLWLVLIGLVLLSLAWGALAAFTATQYSAAAASVVTTREPLSLDAQRIYSTLSDANDAATTAFLTGGIEPAATDAALPGRHQPRRRPASRAPPPRAGRAPGTRRGT